jgi:hypothetical protein
MLVSKKYSNGDVVSFKIVTGDEIVARIVEENDGSFLIEKPCTVMPSPQGMGLMQSLFTADADAKIHLHKDHVIMHSPSIEQMQKHYIKTVTGIEPVTRGSIIT